MEFGHGDETEEGVADEHDPSESSSLNGALSDGCETKPSVRAMRRKLTTRNTLKDFLNPCASRRPLVLVVADLSRAGF